MKVEDISGNLPLKQVFNNTYLEVWGVTTTCVAAMVIATKVLKGDMKVAALLGASTSLGHYTLNIVDHRYMSGDAEAQKDLPKLARTGFLVFCNFKIAKYFAQRGHPVSKAWPILLPAAMAYGCKLEELKQG